MTTFVKSQAKSVREMTQSNGPQRGKASLGTTQPRKRAERSDEEEAALKQLIERAERAIFEVGKELSSEALSPNTARQYTRIIDSYYEHQAETLRIWLEQGIPPAAGAFELIKESLPRWSKNHLEHSTKATQRVQSAALDRYFAAFDVPVKAARLLSGLDEAKSGAGRSANRKVTALDDSQLQRLRSAAKKSAPLRTYLELALVGLDASQIADVRRKDVGRGGVVRIRTAQGQYRALDPVSCSWLRGNKATFNGDLPQRPKQRDLAKGNFRVSSQTIARSLKDLVERELTKPRQGGATAGLPSAKATWKPRIYAMRQLKETGVRRAIQHGASPHAAAKARQGEIRPHWAEYRVSRRRATRFWERADQHDRDELLNPELKELESPIPVDATEEEFDAFLEKYPS